MKKIFLLLMALIAATTVWAEDYITDVMVIGGSKSETNTLKTTYTNQGWTVIDQDLNAGASGDYIFLLYKTADENASGASFITDFYLSSASGTVPDNLEHNGRTYHLAACDGSDYFKNSNGDLNSHCSGSAYIHLYYTKEYLDNGEDYSTVKTISINNTQAGAVGENGGTTGYDLNSGAGGDYIYMHAAKSQGWIVVNSVSENRCVITDFDGPKSAFTSITIPVSINGKMLENFSGSLFGGFTNLETLAFYDNTIVSQMPSMQGCSKFKHVKTGSTNDKTPDSMTSIPASAFVGTAIETINMPSVTNIGEHAFAGTAINTINMPSVTNIGEYAFEGSGINQITLHSCLMEIGTYAFFNCNSLTDIYFDGTQQQWNNVTKGANWKPAATTEHWHCIVTFDVNGHGVAPEVQTVWSNQDKATEPTPPTAALHVFHGWFTEAECTNQWDFNTVVPGDMTLYAKWDAQYTFNSETGELKLLCGEYNSGNKWGSDVPASAVKRVIANSGVSFTGDCSELFYDFYNCTSMDLDSVNTSYATNMRRMFHGCTSLTSLYISRWYTARVRDMYGMFDHCISLTMLDLYYWYTGNVTDMRYMFCDCVNLNTIYVSQLWETEKVTDSNGMFYECTSLVGGMGTTYNEHVVDKRYARIDKGRSEPGYLTGNYIFISETGELKLIWGEFNWDNKWGNDVPTSAVKSVTATSDVSFTGNCMDLFSDFTNCTSMDLKNVNTNNCTNMCYMFLRCRSLTSLDISRWETSNVTDMSGMFEYCSSLTSLDLTGWNTGNVTDMCSMFGYCSNLTSLNLTGWNTGNVTDMSYMFFNCWNLKTIYVDPMWSTENVTNSYCMFQSCYSLVGGMGTTYEWNHIDKEYARIDGGPDCPGYFTERILIVPGDVNGDGEVTAADITALYSFLLTGDTSGLVNGDQDGDGSITSADVTAVYSIILGNKK